MKKGFTLKIAKHIKDLGDGMADMEIMNVFIPSQKQFKNIVNLLPNNYEIIEVKSFSEDTLTAKEFLDKLKEKK